VAKILTVDDSRVIRDLVEAVLIENGHEVVTAEDGVQGLDVTRNEQFDMILSDINMPNMTGISMVSKIRRLAGYEHIPIIMLTTESSDFKKDKAKKMGATGWLQKPFDPERLMKAVNKLIG
jgi:two-component system, chemotaxis family, chemotaxis protein CheY